MNIKLIGLMLLAASTAWGQRTIDLSGKWTAGLNASNDTHEVTLPGSLLTNDLGEKPTVRTLWTGSIYDSSYYFNPYMARYREEGNVKFPFFLTPNRHFVGTVVYRRNIKIPKSWRGQHITLFLERPHIETTVRINGHEAGHQISLTTPHTYDVSSFIRPGKDNIIEVSVYNGIENVCVGQDSHSVTDQTQGNWNGIVGRIELQAHGRHPIKSARISTDWQNRELEITINSGYRKPAFIIDGKTAESRRLSDSTYRISIAGMKLWSEFTPNVYHIDIASDDDTLHRVFGLRDIVADGRQMYLVQHSANGDRLPIWIRGTVENCNFPLTGYPPTDVESWKQIFTKCKQYGLNAMRFHSYCPPEAAFTAADEVGFYLQPEGPSWPNHGVRLRRGMAIDQYLRDETRRITEAYGDHPSFVMLSAGNEPAGDWVRWGNDWIKYIRQADSGNRLYCSFNVGGGWAWDSESEYHVKGGARGLDWDRHAPQSSDDYYEQLLYPRNYKGKEPNNSPIIAHEQGQWCAFPDLSERSQYTGVYKAFNFDIFADLLREHGMEQMARKFLMASGHLQTLCYKYEIERNLRTKDYEGFMLLGLNDYSGQGTALVGALNVFWKEKGYTDSSQWRQFCNTVVPLARFPKFVYEEGERLVVPMELYNASGRQLENVGVEYSLTTADGKKSVIHTCRQSFGIGKNLPMDTVTVDLGPHKTPVKMTLAARAGSYENQWDFWIYPKSEATAIPHDIYATDTLDSKAAEILSRGGKVLITAAGKVRYGNDVSQHYLPVFWNTSWFKMRPPHTTGASIDTSHPLFREFPTDDWGNLNWWELLNKAQVMNLSEFPSDYQSPVQPIDTWHVSRKLGMIIEAQVLGGKLLMTTMDISNNLDSRPVARQMRKAIIDYMESAEFAPKLRLDRQVVTDLFEKTAPPVNMFTNDSPDELKPKLTSGQ